MIIKSGIGLKPLFTLRHVPLAEANGNLRILPRCQNMQGQPLAVL